MSSMRSVTTVKLGAIEMTGFMIDNKLSVPADEKVDLIMSSLREPCESRREAEGVAGWMSHMKLVRLGSDGRYE